MQVENSTVVEPLSNADAIKARIYQLREMLQKQVPGYEGHLHMIHRALAVDPDTVQMLTEEEIGIIVMGLSKRTGTFIAQESAKKVTKKGAKIDLADL